MKLVSTHSLTYHTHCSPTHPSTSTYLHSLSFLAPSGPPLMFRASPQSRTVTFSWRPVDEQQQNGLITNYTITCTPPITINIPVNTNMDLFTVTHQGFTPVTQYSCSIIAMTVVGSGPSATLAFTTMDDDGNGRSACDGIVSDQSILLLFIYRSPWECYSARLRAGSEHEWRTRGS